MKPPLWNEGASPWPHEREALAFVRSRLPDHEPYRAWSNVEFIAGDGSVNEVDLIVATPRGFFLVEIKSFPGILFGDGQRWRLRRPNGSEVRYDHPLILANTKAKRLRSLLARQPAFRREDPPWVTPLVFLSSPDLDCRLHSIGRTKVCGRDPDPLPPGAEPPPPPRTAYPPLPGIVAALKDPTTIGERGTAINKPTSRRIAEALDSAGLQPSNRGRRVGDWDLGELLDEGPGWQDFTASRPQVGAKRRVRIYLSGTATTTEEQDRLRREAEREFRLVQELRHDGIARPLDLQQAERGPALLFDLTEGEERLDLWAANALESMQLEDRIELVRQLGEAVAHAHAQRVSHRALTARCIVMRPGPRESLPTLVIGHWQAGARELATTLTRHAGTAGTTLGESFTDRLDTTEQVYLAPEAFSVESPDPVALDVFSLGAVAHLLLTGQPPASDLSEREQILAKHRGLAVDAVADHLPSQLADFVLYATDPVPARRASVRDLLELLDDALDQLTAPSPTDHAEPGTVDPLTAHQGDRLEGGWEVLRRLGSGSTAVALLCQRPGATEPEVLKVAKDEEHAERLLDEARALEGLRHSCIVQLEGVERIHGRTVLRLAPAGDPADKVGMTLADRIAAQGRVGLDLLERFGEDLLEVVAFLESEGVPHRDIKPENLGVRPRRGDRSLHLVLFDFSLARTPDTSLAAGTPGYLDPFLSERPTKRWDHAADRYAAAATLHEMATGVRPVWGDGRTDPIHVDDDTPRIDPELFDPAVREGLTAFFTRALHRDAAKRFGGMDEMRQAWRSIFSAASRRATITEEDRAADEAVLDQLADAADESTSVVELGLSGAASSALDRIGIGTVRQLLDHPASELATLAGVGLRTKREILDAVSRLRDRFDTEVTDPAASIDRLAGALVPKPTTPRARADAPALTTLLGLDAGATPLSPVADTAEPVHAWPGVTDLAAAHGLDRAAVEELLERARARWSKQPAVTQARHDIHDIVERAGGVAPADEVALALLAQRGSTATGPDRLQRARAVVRAALETEAGREGNRFTWRRLSGGSSAIIALRTDHLDGEELADYASSLGRVADQLAASDPLPTPAAALERLRSVPVPPGLPPMTDHRLLRLATSASSTAAASSRLEVYPRGMSAERAVRLSRAALLGAGTLSEDQVRSRVQTRFPAAARLPDRPELDRILQEAVGLEWFPGGPGPSGVPLASGFRIPPPPAQTGLTAITVSGSRYRTGTVIDAPDEARAEAEHVADRLRRHASAGGYMVITVRPRRYRSALKELTQLGATPVSGDELLVAALRQLAEAKGIRWGEAILATDAAGPEGNQWPRLLTVVRDALPLVRTALLQGPEHVLLTDPGLLGRYDAMGLLDDLRERTTRQLPEPGQTLRTLWVLVPSEDPAALPAIAGHPIPTTTSGERLVVPDSWLHNVQGTTPTGALS